jgi:hypothetical protein
VSLPDERDYWKDTREDVIFVRHDLVINTLPLDKIVPHLEKVAADPHQSELLGAIDSRTVFLPRLCQLPAGLSRQGGKDHRMGHTQGIPVPSVRARSDTCDPPVK